MKLDSDARWLSALGIRRGLLLSAVALALPLSAIGADETVRYKPVSRELVESRLKKYAGNDQQREVTLKGMFADAGCDGEHLSEQAVKGARQPNVICVLPGKADEVAENCHGERGAHGSSADYLVRTNGIG
jgi:hypothetical protein